MSDLHVAGAVARHTSEETRAKGEHFLVGERAIAAIVAAAKLQPGETVVDVGSGLGALTRPIAEAVGPTGTVIAIEKDPEWVERLQLELAQVQFIQGDALKVNLPAGVSAVVANPPFRIIPGLLRRIIQLKVPRAVLVVPTELRDRLTAAPKTEHYGKLTVEIALQAKVKAVTDLPRRAFEPRPEVDCAVIEVIPKATVEADLGLLERILEVTWEGRRRHLGNALGDLGDQVGMARAELESLCDGAGIQGRAFAEVSPFEFGQLSLRMREAIDARKTKA